jgi:hypothetical protein
LNFIARELNGIPTQDVESLLVSLILDGKLNGKIDQTQGILVKDITVKSFGVGGASSSNDTVNNSFISCGSSITRMEAYTCDAMDQLTSSLQAMTTNLATIASDQYLYSAYPSTMM